MPANKGSTTTSVRDKATGLNAAIETIGGKNRLLVDTTASVSVAPPESVLHKPEHLLNGSSNDMAINGGGGTIFITTVPADQTWFVTSLSIYIQDPGTSDPTKFGSISQLSNGLLIEIRINGTTYTFENIKNNKDIIMTFRDQIFAPSATAQFMDDNDVFNAGYLFNPPMKLVTGDYVRATVRNNLSNIEELRMSIQKWRVV